LIKRLDKLDSIGLIHWPKKEGGMPQGKRLLEDAKGIPLQDVWTDLKPIHNISAERLGYPTQKPESLLSRIINASSNPNDIVLDPFCGCGTTITIAERLRRRWIGIDITHLAIGLMRSRLHETFGSELSPYEVIGDPPDISSAHALAQQDRYQFQYWAVGKVEGRPAQDKKKGADAGIDGYLYFFEDKSNKAKKIIIQVKSGHVSVRDIRDLKGVLDREKAEIGAFITLEEPTKPMLIEALSAGFYEPPFSRVGPFSRLQILTIAEILAGKSLEYPRGMGQATFKKAERKKHLKEEDQPLPFGE
jgi:site-specific DNA-methyltransferase (adenine-specific)